MGLKEAQLRSMSVRVDRKGEARTHVGHEGHVDRSDREVKRVEVGE